MNIQEGTVSVFGFVKKTVDGEIRLLFVKDFPRNEEEENSPKIKLPGGNVPEGENPQNFIQRKIREETGISTIFIVEEKDGYRKPLLELGIPGYEGKKHTFLVYELRVSQFDTDSLPIPGGDVSDARFLSFSEILKAEKEGIILENHLLSLKKFLSCQG